METNKADWLDPWVFLSDSCLHAWHPSRQNEKNKCTRLWGSPTSSQAPTQQETINSIKESKLCQRQGSEMTTAAFAFFMLFTWMVSSNAWFRVCHQCSDFDLCGHTEGKRSQNAFTQLAHYEKAAVRKANLTWKGWVKLVVNYKLKFCLHCWSFMLFSWTACFSGPAHYLVDVHILGPA